MLWSVEATIDWVEKNARYQENVKPLNNKFSYIAEVSEKIGNFLDEDEDEDEDIEG